MSDTSPDPSRPAKPALPTRRAEGDKPRSLADHTADAIGLSGSEENLKPAPPEVVARRGKSSLPSERKRERSLPSLTPAPYQTEPSTGLNPARRADLPGPRRSDQHPKFRPPTAPHEAEEDSEELHDGDLTVATPEESPAATPVRPVKHRIADNRTLEFTRQGSIEGDPELTEAWGHAGPAAGTERPGSRRIILWATVIGLPLIAFALWQSLGRPGVDSPDLVAPIANSNAADIDAAAETRRASEVIKRFLATTTIEERATYVRNPEVARPRMEAWYTAANPLKAHEVLEFDDRSSEQTIDDITFLMLTMVMADYKERAIAVEKRPNGEFLVDWESFVHWSDPRWPEFLSKETPGSHEFRVQVQIEDYFNNAYADPKQWFCYKLNDPENWAHCYGYCSIDSEVGMTINRMIRRQRQQGKSDIKAVLKLKFEDVGKGQNQVLIEEVVQDGWIKTDP